MQSRLAEAHGDGNADYNNWTFSSVRHWGELSVGTWSVNVADRAATDTGTLRNLEVRLYGTETDVSNRPPVIATSASQYTVSVTNLLTFVVSASEPDGDMITLSATNLPAGAVFAETQSTGLVQSTFSWTPATNAAGTYAVAFRASDKDGATERTVTIRVGSGGSLDIGGYTLLQYNSSQSFAMPAPLELESGQYLVIARDAEQSAFETYWGVTLGSDVIFLNSGGVLPQINGAEVFELRDAANATLEGPTGLAIGSGQAVQRTTLSGNAASAGSWVAGASSTATPGAGAPAGAQAGLAITEYADALGTGNFVYEFVELYLDGGGGGTPGGTPPVLSGLAGQTVVVGTTLEFLVRADDADGDLITLTSTNLPNHAVFAATTGVSTVTAPFSFTPALSQTGTVAVTFLASASDGTTTGTVSITVIPEAVATITNLVYFDFETSAGVFEVSPEMAAGHLQASDFGIHNDNPQFFKGNPGQALAGTGWDAADESRYFSMSVTVDSGYAMHITSVSFDDRASGTGPVDWTVVSSRDTFNTAWGTGATHVDSFGPNLIEHMESDVTGTLEIRIAGANASSASGTWRIDNVRLMGYVVPTGAAWIDADGDGMPDEWEFQYSGSITGLVAHADDDADGAFNSEEFISGTDPFDEYSVLRIGDVTGMQQGLIAFPGRQGRRYQLQVATNLMEALPWRDAAGPVSGSNTLMQLQDPVATGQRYYRIRVEIE